MTEGKQEDTQPKPLTPEQLYFEGILKKFNANPNDTALSEAERVLLSKIKATQTIIADLAKQVEDLNTEIRERQEKGDQLIQQLIHAQGQSQGFVDSLLALR
jgi:t-SNARE complex subunit (syntaxin)